MTRLLVPVAESPTMRRTVEYAVEAAIREADEVILRAVFLPALRAEPGAGTPSVRTGNALLERVEGWVEETAAGASVTVSVDTAVLDGTDDLYTPLDVAEVLLSEVESAAIDRVVLDPGYGPQAEHDFLDPIGRLLREEAEVEVVVAPFETSPGLLPGSIDIPRAVFVFLVSFAFYLVLAGGITVYGVVTGAVTAGIVTMTIGAITLWFAPGIRYTPMRFVRAAVFIPYLLVAITRANLTVSRVILDPDLPIDPAVVRYHPAVYGPFPLATLGNSITLTPGTLSMRVEDGDLLVHSLIPSAREGLAEGSLERGVRFVFFGRRAMRMPSPAERGDIEVTGEEGDLP